MLCRLAFVRIINPIIACAKEMNDHNHALSSFSLTLHLQV
jgi:hypothetical protein